MYFHPSFLRVEMIERLFTQTYGNKCFDSWRKWNFNNAFQSEEMKWFDQLQAILKRVKVELIVGNEEKFYSLVVKVGQVFVLWS